MKMLYWNIRGIANAPSRLALKRLILKHKPDFVFVAEPWMDYSNFPLTWFHRLGFKIFSCNSRENLLPNLWCFCTFNYNPIVVNKDEQQVSFSFILEENTFYVSAVYASTSYWKRKELWQKLTSLQTQFDAPWAFIGDFNVILGSHEHKGAFQPARAPMNDFQSWSDLHSLLHLPTRGVEFTWDNRRFGRRHTKKRLDRTICNQQWLDSCAVISCSSLIKLRSDHYPLLLDFRTLNLQMASSFKFLKMWTLHDTCHKVIEESWNVRILGSPMYILSSKLKMLKDKLKVWNKEVFGNIHLQVAEAEKNLNDIQDQINISGNNDTLMNEEKIAQTNLDLALHKQETFWLEKAKLKWHVDGDRNTKYFHRLTKIKNKTKIISSLRNGEDIITDQERISEHVVSYYNFFFY